MADGFRIGRISVEGFKGFTEIKEIDLKNRHVFLIGPNGNGKSSIVEAIRWGLFGSTGRRNDIVRNAGYGGDCCVEISLTRDGREWRLRRILTPGGGSNSRAELFDEGGKEHPIRDVMPQMDSLDAGEGTHIIFAPQSAPLRRQPEDLTPFERTVFGHLGLTHARALLSHIEAFVQDQDAEESDLDSLVSEAQKQVDSRIAYLERKRGLILSSPPWGGDLQPSVAETENKAKKLIKKISTSELGNDTRQFSLHALVDEAERALEERIGLNRTPLDEELKELEEELTRLENIQNDWEGIALKREDREQAAKDLQRVLDGMSLDELEKRVENQRRNAEILDLRHQLGEIASELLNRAGLEKLTTCPLCKSDRQLDELNCVINAMISEEGEKESTSLLAMESQLDEAQGIDSRIQILSQDIKEGESTLETLVVTDVELSKAVREGRVTNYIESVKSRESSVAAQINDFENWCSSVEAELTKLREEARYQQLQRDLSDTRAVAADMKLVQRSYGQLVKFGESVRDIRDSVEYTLTNQLRKKVPVVAEELTGVFSALTRHPHYDRLTIDEETLPSLELRVASSSTSSGTPHPTGVLNGQAQSALELVPYFALSQADEAPTEVYLVLLDDPTRAFDKEHIKILIERLADLGKRVQVVVATQETETFRDLLPKSFERESYVIVEPKNWSYTDGPELVTEYK